MYLSSAPLKAPAPVTSSSTTEPDPNTELQPESASALPSFAPDFLPPLQTTNSTGPRVPSPSFQTAGQLWNQNHLKMACFEEAKQASIALSKDESSTEKAHELHLLDLYKTQKSYQGPIPDDASILILVKFPDHISARSCQSTDFQTGKLRLTLKQLESTGSAYLINLLSNCKYQERAKKAAAPLPDGVSHVINLSPTLDEEDYTLALQKLSLPRGVKLWYRSMAFGTSPMATAGHDDACSCLLLVDEKYQKPEAPANAVNNGVMCIFDEQDWPVSNPFKVPDFSEIRWGANILRLFRWIARPEGTGELLIDSAPRMWTLVGLFSKLQMTNYGMLRDNVTAWFITNKNFMFVELCPEETLYIGTTLKIPLIAEPAFRILVNERALEVAGGQPRSEPTTTIFGRRCSNLSGTDEVEAISRVVEHAGIAMAERYKAAVDTIKGDDLLDALDVSMWNDLRELENVIPKYPTKGMPLPVRVAYDEIMEGVRDAVRQEMARFYINGSNGSIMGSKPSDLPFLGSAWVAQDTSSLTPEAIDELRSYTVPKRVLEGSLPFEKIWASLNEYQRALTPVYWQIFREIQADRMAATFFTLKKNDALSDFVKHFNDAKLTGQLAQNAHIDFGPESVRDYFRALFKKVQDKVREYVMKLVDRGRSSGFVYMATPHLLVNCNDDEMNYLRQEGDETRFQPHVPEADMGPSGPGPAFRTGRTVPSISDMDLEHLSVESDYGGASTVLGSVVAQDGVSTVFDRRRVLVGTGSSVASDPFTDGDSAMENAYAEAEFAVPAAHQSHGQDLDLLIEDDDEDQLEEFEFQSDISGDEDEGAGSELPTETDRMV